jgi:hypothetical protein
MPYALQSGLQVSINGTTWYKLTDHNRSEIEITPTLIEKEARTANGTLRKFVVAKKDVISVGWNFLPSKPASTGNVSNDTKFSIVDSNYAGSWMQSFYNANVGIPIYLKIISAKHTDPATGAAPSDATYVSSSTGEKIYQVFMTGFSKTIVKRNPVTDFLDITLEFTEI